MKQLFLLAFVFLFSSVSVAQTPQEETTTIATDNSVVPAQNNNVAAVSVPVTKPATPAENKSVVGSWIQTITNLQQIQESITENQIALKFERALTFPSLIEIDRIDKELDVLHEELNQTEERFGEILTDEIPHDENDEAIVESLLLQKQQDIDALELEKTKYKERYAMRKSRQEANILRLEEELDDLEESRQKQWQLIQAQGLKFIFYIGGILLFIALFWVVQFLSSQIIKKLASHLSERRRKALLALNRIVFGVLIAIIALGLVFSQFINLLPFVALLGTGLAFAVRDTISSFIAWFFIGGDRGYKTGDTISFSSIKGQVIEVSPLLTTLRDQSHGYNSGKIITFPNKAFFEQPMYNHSRSLGYEILELSFLMADESDLEKAKKGLEGLILSVNETGQKEIEQKASKIVSDTYFDASELSLKVWQQNESNGVFLKARFMVRDEDSEEIESQIRDQFISWVKKEKSIDFHFIDVGRDRKKKK